MNGDEILAYLLEQASINRMQYVINNAQRIRLNALLNQALAWGRVFPRGEKRRWLDQARKRVLYAVDQAYSSKEVRFCAYQALIEFLVGDMNGHDLIPERVAELNRLVNHLTKQEVAA